MSPILWYIHHHGWGHLRRFAAIAAHLQRPVHTASSLGRPDGSPGHTLLPRDDEDLNLGDPGGRGRLHFAPLGGVGFRRRQRLIADFIDDVAPALAVVDVSVEVGVLARLLGVPVVAVRQPGDRSDPAHELLYEMAEVLLAPWPADWSPGSPWDDKTVFFGLPAPEPAEWGEDDSVEVLVVVGGGGSSIGPDAIESIAASGEMVTVAGLDGPDSARVEYLGRVGEVAGLMARSGVVIGGAGLNTVAEVAAAGRPFVCVPEPRPFGEQEATASALRQSGCAVVIEEASGADWAAAIAEARAGGGSRWGHFLNPGGWRLAASTIDRAAASLEGRP